MSHRIITPPAIDQETIDRAIARGKRERSRAVLGALRSLFRAFVPVARTVRSHEPA